MKFLVVDDSSTMRMLMKRTLRQAGFGGHIVEEAENGADALEKIQIDQPDLVLCDWNMPVMTGIRLLETLRDLGIRVKFGFVTAEGTPEMRAKATARGAQFLISKPFTSLEFEYSLSELLAA